MEDSNKSNEYKRLYERYNKMSNEELSEIAKPDSGYKELAIQVATDILNSDRTEYYENIDKYHENNKIQNTNIDDLLLNLNKNIRSIKNMLLFFVILTILGLIFGFYAVFFADPSLL